MNILKQLFGKTEHINPTWKRTSKVPKSIRDDLFVKVNTPKSQKPGTDVSLAYSKDKNKLYKVVMKPDYNSRHFNFDFYERKINS